MNEKTRPSLRMYRVLLNGRNFLMQLEQEAPAKTGFYQSYWLEAVDSTEAERIAIDRARSNKELRLLTLNEREDVPLIFVDEIEEVEDFSTLDANPSGFAFYDEGDEPSSLPSST